MLKIKSKSLVVSEDIAPELKQHIALLIQREEEQMRYQMERQNLKEARLLSIEKEFVQWADKKESHIRQKLSKSVKNKEDHLNKIVKKCKDHEHFINQKYKNVQTKKKACIKDAWKKAQQFNHSIQDYHQSKHISHQNRLNHQRSKEKMAQSRFVEHKFVPLEKEKQYVGPSNNPSKYYSNASKDYWAQFNQSVRLHDKEKMAESAPKEEKVEERAFTPKINHTSKLKETIARFKQNIKDEEQGKIQQLGQRLQKISQSRHKKIQLYKKKKEPRQQYLETQHIERKKPKKNADKSQRIHSQTIMREKRVRDWSEYNKHKREQYLQNHLQQGNNYLQAQKLKQMKTSLAKKIAGTALQKKLYFQRLNH